MRARVRMMVRMEVRVRMRVGSDGSARALKAR